MWIVSSFDVKWGQGSIQYREQHILQSLWCGTYSGPRHMVQYSLFFVKSFYNKLLLNHEFFFLLNIQPSSQFCSENILAWANPRLKNVSIIDITLIYLILDILFNPLFLPLVKLKYNHF